MAGVVRRGAGGLRMMGMSPWMWPAVAFALLLCVAALVRRRFLLAAGFVAYGLLAVWLSAADAPLPRFVAPLLVLVAGYWLTAPFYTRASPELEAWLMRGDHRLEVDRFAAAAPRWFGSAMEAAYAGCYPFIVVAAIPAFRHSADAFAWHWTLVLSAELACYVTLPWLQARPPRELRNSTRLIFPGSDSLNREKSTGSNFLRRFNERVLRHLSVRATTIPSGHVAGPVAASLAAWMIAPEYGPWLLAGAAAITAATVIGRYHYAIDALLGALVGALPPAVRAFWL